MIGEEMAMKLFDCGKPIPAYLEKHGKLHGILMMLLAFVIMPITSILIVTLTCQSVGLRVVQTTVSMLAWFNGKFAEVYIWGLLNIALYCYLLKLNLDSQQYSKQAKIAFYVLFAAGVVILLTGLSLEFTDEPSLQHTLHNTFAIIGFVMIVVIAMLLIITAFWRDKTQAAIMTAFLCFFVISGVFSIPQINSPDSGAFITAATQMYIFAMLHVILALNCCIAKIIPTKNQSFYNKY